MYLRKQKPKKYAFGDWLESQPQAYENKANISTESSAQQTSDTITGAASLAMPVIGLLSEAGHAIGDPIVADKQKIDPNSGGYQSLSDANVGKVLENQFDPILGGFSTLENEQATTIDKIGAFTGFSWATSNSLTEREDAAMREKFSQEKTRQGTELSRQNAQQNFAQADRSEYSGLSNFEFGGYLDGGGSVNGGRTYKGPSHEDSRYEGIPVDKNGEPSVMSGGETVGLTEGNEFKYTFKDKNTYIFSDKY